jgi:hypothetical protein
MFVDITERVLLEQEKAQLEAQNIYLLEEIRSEHNFDEIVGNSPSLLEVLRQAEQIAKSDCTVLIVGETGTGSLNRLAAAKQLKSTCVFLLRLIVICRNWCARESPSLQARRSRFPRATVFLRRGMMLSRRRTQPAWTEVHLVFHKNARNAMARAPVIRMMNEFISDLQCEWLRSGV